MITKDRVKALRLIFGFNDDLRIKIKFTPSMKRTFYDFIEKNPVGIFGSFDVLLWMETNPIGFDREVNKIIYCLSTGTYGDGYKFTFNPETEEYTIAHKLI